MVRTNWGIPMRKLLITIAALALVNGAANSHDGTTNQWQCHRSPSSYHCHSEFLADKRESASTLYKRQNPWRPRTSGRTYSYTHNSTTDSPSREVCETFLSVMNEVADTTGDAELMRRNQWDYTRAGCK